MTDRFREDGGQAVASAEEIAQRLGRAAIGPMDLAFGIADEALAAGRILDETCRFRDGSGTSLGFMARLVSTISEAVRVAPYRHPLPLGRDAEAVLTLAGEEAEGLGDDAIGSEHILLALLLIRDTPAVLQWPFDLTYHAAREAIVRHREGTAG